MGSGRKFEFLFAHLDLLMQVLLSDVVIDGPHDLLVDVVCIGRVLVAAHAQEFPEPLLPVPGALHDEVLQPSHIHALIKLHPCTCAHMPPHASPPRPELATASTQKLGKLGALVKLSSESNNLHSI